MTIYNVKGTVVALVEASSEADAVTKLRALLDKNAAVTLHDDTDCWHAFESEDQDATPNLDGFVR